jgi:hypothetical protein
MGRFALSLPPRTGPTQPCQDPGVSDEPRVDLTDFDRYIEERGIAEEDWPAAFALWIAEVTGGPVPRFEKG